MGRCPNLIWKQTAAIIEQTQVRVEEVIMIFDTSVDSKLHKGLHMAELSQVSTYV